MIAIEVDRNKVDHAKIVNPETAREYKNATHTYHACGLRFRWHRYAELAEVFVVREWKGTRWEIICKGPVEKWPRDLKAVSRLLERILAAEARAANTHHMRGAIRA